MKNLGKPLFMNLLAKILHKTPLKLEESYPPAEVSAMV